MKQKLIDGDEYDVVGGNRRRYKYLQRAGVVSRIKRAMRRRLRREGRQCRPPAACRLYYCPTAEDYECCGGHCGFDVCCDKPELHVYLAEAPVARAEDVDMPERGGQQTVSSARKPPRSTKQSPSAGQAQ